MLPGAFVWDVAAMAGCSLDALAERVMLGHPFAIDVDAERCHVMWGLRAVRLWCQPHPTPFGSGWIAAPCLATRPLPFGGTAAAGPEGPEPADDGPARDPASLLPSSSSFSFHAPPSSAVPLPGLGAVALGIGVDDCFAEGPTCR